MFTTKSVVLSAGAFLLGFIVALAFFRGGNRLEAGAALRPEIILYSQPDFQGRELHLFEDAVDLPFEDLAGGTQFLWNDNIASIVVVSGTWRLYQNGRMNTALDETPMELVEVRSKAPSGGWSSVLSATSRGPLKLATMELAGIDGDISSVELVSAYNLPDWVYRAR